MIYITGTSGFVGTNLSRYLRAKGHKTSAILLRDVAWQSQNWTNPTAIIHLAGKAHDTTNTSAEEKYYEINRDLTVEVFEKFLQSDIRDFFYFSSVKAVADTVDAVLLEDAIANPLTPYGKSKLEAETILLKTPLPEGKRLFIVRPCMIHGAGNKGNLNLLYKVVSKGLPWPLASFHNARSFISIDNLCYLIDQIINKPEIPSGIYNFADDTVLSTNDVITITSGALGKKVKLWKTPKGLVKLLAKMGDACSLPLNSERLKKLTESYVVSNQKIKDALGIDKLPLTAQEGMEKTIRSFVDSKE
ncbi:MULTISPECIES: NAD-dependent epimerase/dehydratase family protein [Sphingobacterium]|uniref:NAD-dependent epimerase/dehydratase family protein n=1 Tax=Sphingobacterium populi TaxID=1812824 RepID=A0ABW5UCL1_9SPHI|nr:NAD-dependent epimerase/dehydratase family protein [Sphingobacterium sp. CFCC 11742]